MSGDVARHPVRVVMPVHGQQDPVCMSLRIECGASMVEPEFIGGLTAQSMTTHATHRAYLDLAQPRWGVAR